uniref:Retrotransposon gag domain-containing protein n=1 Tax=Tanacetum cinerariifolium TaxID=118510 RepID=A0A6L2LFI5_TANCI|nr:hypothetical protein [Tanacetum cinerariifolium]
MAGVDINTLTMEQYLALSGENQEPGIVKPEIRGNVNFKIKSQFMQELKEDTFSENKNEDAHNHVDRVLNIISLFNILGVSQDALVLRVFLFTLTGATKIWVDRFTARAVRKDESLYQAWERYNYLLYKYPTHDINSHQMVNVFYKGLSTMNRQLLDSQGPIPGMTPTQALTVIQTMVDHSQKWHDETSSRNISSSSDTDGLAAIISKLDNLGRDRKKLKENVHAIQVGCQIYKGPHLDKECPVNEKVKQVEKVNYGEFERPAPFNENNESKLHVGPPRYYTRIDNQTPSREKKSNLVETINKYMEEAAKRQAEQDEWLKTFFQNTKKVELITVQESYEEIVCKCSLIAQEANGELRFGEVSETARDKILRDHWRNRFENEYDESEDFEDPDGCGESKENKILETTINKLHYEWFKGTVEDDDDLEGIIDYLEPTLYDGFIDSDDEEYKERKCKLLGMPYIKPPLILIEKGQSY